MKSMKQIFEDVNVNESMIEKTNKVEEFVSWFPEISKKMFDNFDIQKIDIQVAKNKTFVYYKD